MPQFCLCVTVQKLFAYTGPLGRLFTDKRVLSRALQRLTHTYTSKTRSGQTTANRLGLTQGQADGELTDKGRQQAKLLGKRLATEVSEFAAVYVSDLGRTRATWDAARAAGPVAVAGPVELTPALRERAAGVFEGQPYGTADREARRQGQSTREFAADGGGESWVQVEERAAAFFARLLAAHPPDPARVEQVLVVTHGGWIKELVNSLIPLLQPQAEGAAASAPRKQLLRPYGNVAKNTGVFVFRVLPGPAGGPRWRVCLEVENDASHLPAEQQDQAARPKRK